MGHLLEPHGPITIETDSDDGFIIHAGYGYGRRTKQAMDTKLRDELEIEGQRVRVVSIDEEEGVRVVSVDGELSQVLGLGDVVQVPDSEVRVDHPLGDHWRSTPHPPFMDHHLDELIDALQAYKAYRRNNP